MIFAIKISKIPIFPSKLSRKPQRMAIFAKMNLKFLVMKKSIATIIALLAAIPAFCQEIAYDNVDANGARIIMSSCIKEGPMELSVDATSVAKESGEKVTDFYIGVIFTDKHSLEIPEQGAMLLRLGDGRVIRCTCTRGSGDSQGYQSGKKTMYTVSTLYQILEDDVKAIISQGVKKVRIEFAGKKYDKEYSDPLESGFRMAVATLYPLVTTALQQEKKLPEGF